MVSPTPLHRAFGAYSFLVLYQDVFQNLTPHHLQAEIRARERERDCISCARVCVCVSVCMCVCD